MPPIIQPPISGPRTIIGVVQILLAVFAIVIALFNWRLPRQRNGLVNENDNQGHELGLQNDYESADSVARDLAALNLAELASRG
ncbi:hypothetical protein H2201_003020 [Coniosporium apollinis]|uniref:Uncharacterized protein n=2 Tax=Coniosporium TaxID=2810619 RepID=A0ABQ9NWY7_9PEZI|nr:hypothetical protein H2199_007764 [Cladosporium sp. JES 115]KAJ9666886.1 hypothetical protein H2201_003020 [Coniosporium apollinis]